MPACNLYLKCQQMDNYYTRESSYPSVSKKNKQKKPGSLLENKYLLKRK